MALRARARLCVAGLTGMMACTGVGEPGVEQGDVATLDVSPATTTLTALGDTVHFTAVARDSKGTVLGGQAVIWSSSNTHVASVDSATGMVTAVGNGTVSILASAGKALATASVTVSQVVRQVSISPSSRTIPFLLDTLRLAATARDANDSIVIGKSFVWSSDQQSVATVSTSGLVTAHAYGTAVISAAVGDAKGAAVVTVAQVVASITLNPPAADLGSPGSTFQLIATVWDARFGVIDKPLAWTSSDTGVARVSAGGWVTSVAQGSVTITASADGVSAAATVAVGIDCFANLPAPSLELKGVQQRMTAGYSIVEYDLTITNRSGFPDRLFWSSPDLPPCGSNQYASRTWVDIYNQDNTYVYGFCALGTSSALGGIWFARQSGDPPPQSVYVVLTDRRCNASYKSNTLTIGL